MITRLYGVKQEKDKVSLLYFSNIKIPGNFRFRGFRSLSKIRYSRFADHIYLNHAGIFHLILDLFGDITR